MPPSDPPPAPSGLAVAPDAPVAAAGAAVAAVAALQALPTPAMGVDSQGLLLWANTAARQQLGAEAGQPFASLWAERDQAAAVLQEAPTGPSLPPLLRRADGQAAFQLRAAALDGGQWLLTAEAADLRLAAETEVARLTELLDLAREFGRLGVWERDLRTFEGRWDDQVMRFWGLEPGSHTPDFARAVQNILPADREALAADFQASLKRAGRYAVRYRVRRPDGSVRRIHSQWVVKNGPDGQPARQIGLMMDDTEPFRLAQSASELESQLQLAVELAGIAVWRHDLATQRMHYSDLGWQVLGLPPRPDGLTLDEARALVHPDDLPRVVASAEAALRSRAPVDVEARYRHADGRWLHQILRRTVLRDAHDQPVAFLGVAMEATERLEQRRRAEELAQRIELVTGAAGIGYWVHEQGQARAQWSTQLRSLFGLSPGEPVPGLRSWLRHHVHRDDRARVLALMGAVASGPPAGLRMVFRGLRRDGHEMTLSAHTLQQHTRQGRVLLGVMIDFSDRARSERALLAAEQRAALAMRGAGLGTWEFDPDTGESHWDAQMWRLRGQEPQSRAMTTAERVACTHPDDRERLAAILKRQIAEGTTQEHEFRVVWPDGQVRWLASRSSEIVDPANQRRRRIGVNWDITDRRTAETVRGERESALRESAAKSRFLARMSHELRTPLNAVLGFTQLLLDDTAGSDAASAQRSRRLHHIQAAGLHLLSLINDVLDLSGLEGGEVRVDLAAVDLPQAVQQTLALVETQARERGIALHADVPAVHVRADPTRLRQVLLNRLSNAVSTTVTAATCT